MYIQYEVVVFLFLYYKVLFITFCKNETKVSVPDSDLERMKQRQETTNRCLIRLQCSLFEYLFFETKTF